MKKLMLVLMLAGAVLNVSATQKVIVNENFAKKMVSPDGKTILLAYGQTHKYVKIMNKKTVEVDGVQYKLVMYGVSPLGRVWHLNMIYNQ